MAVSKGNLPAIGGKQGESNWLRACGTYQQLVISKGKVIGGEKVESKWR